MNDRGRLIMFLVAAAGIAAMLVWAFAGLPDFGHYAGHYGQFLDEHAPAQRHVANVVSIITFDYRGVDTMIEEFILFTAAVGVAMLLRAQRSEVEQEPRDAADERSTHRASDLLRLVGLGSVGPTVVVGIYIVAHGHLSPGGGFQGGTVLSGALVLVFLAGEYLAFKRAGPLPIIDAAEATGAVTFVIVGLIAFILGATFMHNFLPYGTFGELDSSGFVPIINSGVALEVAAAFSLLMSEFLEQTLVIRSGGR